MSSELPPEGRRALVGLALAALVIGAGLTLFFYLQSAAQSEVSGSLTLDAQTFEPRRCRSGRVEEDGPRDMLRFQGVDLLGSSGGRLVRVLEDPAEGASVLVVDPGAAPRAIDRDACERFDVELRETGQLIMEVWGMEGSIALECPDIRGEVRFESCYSGG